jgi:hypothetical protein
MPGGSPRRIWSACAGAPGRRVWTVAR